VTAAEDLLEGACHGLAGGGVHVAFFLCRYAFWRQLAEHQLASDLAAVKISPQPWQTVPI
jgi:hypothetical protein